MTGDALLLSLRQCATHTAGPLRAVADLAIAVPDLGLAGVEDLARDVTAQLDAMDMLPERRATIVAFLAVVWQGLRTLAVECGRVVIVAVFGKGRNCPVEVARLAYDVGATIAQAGHVLLSGALAGVMFDSADGANAAGGQVIGLAPVEGDVDPRFPGVVLHTGLTAHVRNVVMGNACDVAVMLHGSHGAMQELAIVLDREIPVVAVGTDRWVSMGVCRIELNELPGWLQKACAAPTA